MHLGEFENTWVCSSSKNWQGAGFLSQYDIDKHVINRLICVNHGKFISSCTKKCTGPILQNLTSKRCTKLSCFGSEEVNAPRILKQCYWKFQNEELSSIFDFSCSKFEQKKACLRQKLQHEANCHAHVTKYRWAVGNALGGFQPLDEALKCYISISTRQLNLEKMVT